MMKERFLLAAGRIAEVEKEERLREPYRTYFQKTAVFLSLLVRTYEFVESGEMDQAPLAELQERNHKLYEDILPAGYETSYANPAFAVGIFGEEMGKIVAFLTAELRSLIAYAHEGQLAFMTYRMELFLEVYGVFTAEEEGMLPEAEAIRQILYWFASDYAEEAAEEKIAGMVDASKDFAGKLVMERDLKDLRYLYYYGEYVTENEIRTAEHLLALPEETIQLMAGTMTEGYRKGFETTGKDMTKKKTVNIRYCLGFERMVRQAVVNFAEWGLQPVLYRAQASVIDGKGVQRIGYFGAIPNKQYDYDHKDDLALLWDRQLMTRRLEGLQTAYEGYKKQAGLFGGPAVIEVFGEEPCSLVNKEEAPRLSEQQQQWMVEYTSAAGEMQNRYIPGEERSFTIIAFPIPGIGEKFREIFDETIRINTLDYSLYRDIQQTIIDVLDQGEYVLVKGMGANRTDLKICLPKITDPSRETVFENCVADVNIPVGEVFTSPRLAGTEGILHVTRVFLNELEYQDMTFTVKEGMITDYDCGNFDTQAENRSYVKEHVLHHHTSLPMGEFAIGTNTTAYMAGKKYGIAHCFPILIAEKTGPHFAFGDTCYSHAEDVPVYNANGKEIIARDNEISLLRKQGSAQAYYNCHTDITIPYDELGELTVVLAAGERIPIIAEGRFVLAGCEELNRPLEQQLKDA